MKNLDMLGEERRAEAISGRITLDPSEADKAELATQPQG
jgi:hypothetical protein